MIVLNENVRDKNFAFLEEDCTVESKARALPPLLTFLCCLPCYISKLPGSRLKDDDNEEKLSEIESQVAFEWKLALPYP